MENGRDAEISKSIRSNFGAWGWFVIIFAFLSFMFAGNLIVDSLNVTVDAFSQMHGWKMGVLLSYSTVAGLIAIAGSGILSKCASRYGVKIVYCISLAVVAACCMVWGSITSLKEYAVIVILVNIFGNGFGFVGGTALLANWFPRKKGLAMGWATIGFQASAVVLLPIYQYMLEKYDLTAAYRLVGICLLALLIICIVFLKGFPEERGCAPDNDWSVSIEEMKKEHAHALEIKAEKEYSTLELIRIPQIWQIGLVNGLVQLAITVMIVQFIPNLVVCGFSVRRATWLYSGASVIGGLGSYLWGVLDQRIGVKKASIWMCIVHAVGGALFGLIASQIGGKFIAVLAALVVGSILGVSSNYVGSFTAQVFGRYGYSSSFALIIMIVTGMRAFGYSLIGVINTATGSNTIAYLIAAGLSLLAMFITISTDDRCIDPTQLAMMEEKRKGRNDRTKND